MRNKKMSQKFESKADTLVFLQRKLKKGIIEELITFTVEKWQIEKKSILQKIIDKFYPNEVIIRSSAIGEDSIESTEAGKYKSIQKIPTKNKKKIVNYFINKDYDYIIHLAAAVGGLYKNLNANIDMFSLKNYLFNHIKLDTPSTTRHRFGKLYLEKNGSLYFKLNLQLRF